MNLRNSFDPSPDILVYGLEVNRQQNVFMVACENGFRAYDTKTCSLKCFREFKGAFKFATIHDMSNLIGLIPANKGGPKAFKRHDSIIYDNAANESVIRYNDNPNIPLRMLLSRKLLVIVCELGLGIFKITTRGKPSTDDLLHSYPTIANPHAIGILGQRFLVFPGISRGKLQLVDLSTMKSAIINAHNSSLRAIALSADEELLASTSNRGTLVRVWSTTTQSRVAEFRRGLEESAIYSLAFSLNNELLALTSGKGTVHIFELSSPATPDSPKISDNDRRPPETSRRPTHSRHSSVSKHASTDQRAHRLSFPSALKERDYMTESDILQLGAVDQDPGIPTWTHVSGATQNQKKSARFMDQVPASLISDEKHGYVYSEYANSTHTTDSSASGVGAASKAKKYGSLANLPFAPRVLKDQYSVCSASFKLPGRVIEPSTLDESALYTPPPTIPPPTVGSLSTAMHRKMPSAPQGKNLTQGLARPSSLADSAPPKGQIAWIGDLEVVIVSAGRGGRWERFVIERGTPDGQSWGIRNVEWKPYLDEEGR